jgi:hypothetical protein
MTDDLIPQGKQQDFPWNIDQVDLNDPQTVKTILDFVHQSS